MSSAQVVSTAPGSESKSSSATTTTNKKASPMPTPKESPIKSSRDGAAMDDRGSDGSTSPTTTTAKTTISSTSEKTAEKVEKESIGDSDATKKAMPESPPAIKVAPAKPDATGVVRYSIDYLKTLENSPLSVKPDSLQPMDAFPKDSLNLRGASLMASRGAPMVGDSAMLANNADGTVRPTFTSSFRGGHGNRFYGKNGRRHTQPATGGIPVGGRRRSGAPAGAQAAVAGHYDASPEWMNYDPNSAVLSGMSPPDGVEDAMQAFRRQMRIHEGVSEGATEGTTETQQQQQHYHQQQQQQQKQQLAEQQAAAAMYQQQQAAAAAAAMYHSNKYGPNMMYQSSHQMPYGDYYDQKQQELQANARAFVAGQSSSPSNSSGHKNHNNNNANNANDSVYLSEQEHQQQQWYLAQQMMAQQQQHAMMAQAAAQHTASQNVPHYHSNPRNMMQHQESLTAIERQQQIMLMERERAMLGDTAYAAAYGMNPYGDAYGVGGHPEQHGYYR